MVEVVLVGAGPIGIEVAAGLLSCGISYVHIESSCLAHTITRWPSEAKFLSSPERVEIAGVPMQTSHQEAVSGEEYVAYLRSVVEYYDLQIHLYERVTAISGVAGDFTVTTDRRGTEARYRARRIVLATGDMNRPRRIGIPGEDLPHVSHRFADPHPYFRQRLLIVGGRNSAVEAALRCFRMGATVAISYRRPTFEKTHLYSRYHLEIGILTGKNSIAFYPSTVPVEIRRDEVVLEERPFEADTVGSAGTHAPGRRFTVPADFVLVAAGFDADMSLFRSLGGTFNDDGTPVVSEESMESEIPGVYLAGTAANGEYPRYSVFVGTAHHHAEAIVGHILRDTKGPADSDARDQAPDGKRGGPPPSASGVLGWSSGAAAGRRYTFDNEDIRTH